MSRSRVKWWIVEEGIGKGGLLSVASGAGGGGLPSVTGCCSRLAAPKHRNEVSFRETAKTSQALPAKHGSFRPQAVASAK